MPQVVDPTLVGLVNARAYAALQTPRRNSGNTAYEWGTGVWTDQSYTNPAWITSLANAKITGLGSAALQTTGFFAQVANNLSDIVNPATARTNLGLGSSAVLASDTDGTLAANSDSRIPTQKAIVTYVAARAIGALKYKGTTDCSANPNYPSAFQGDMYLVSVAGKIGGASGTTVDIGDWYIANADNAGGTEASVGMSWGHLEHNLVNAVIQGGPLGTPSSGTLTNCTGYTDANLSTSDVTTNNFTTAKHGFVPKGTNVGSFLKDDGTWAAVTVPAAANPTATIGTAAVNGSASTFMRSDAAPAFGNLTGDVTSVGLVTTLTNAPVIAKVLTGYTSGAGTVAATDSILQAIQKLNGNDATNANLTGDVTSVGNATTVAKIQTVTVSGVTGTGNVMLSASPTTTGTLTAAAITASGIVTATGGVITPKIYPAADSTTAIQILKANGTTAVVTVDTTNGFVGIGVTPVIGLQVKVGSSGISVPGGGMISAENAGNVFVDLVSRATDTVGFRFNAGANTAGGVVYDGGTSAVPGMRFLTNATNRVAISEAGLVGINKMSSIGAQLEVDSSTAGTIAVIAKAAASASADLFQAQKSDATVYTAIDSVGNLKLKVAGVGFYVKEGTNATMGSAALSGGTATVSTTKVTASSRIFLTDQGGGVLANIGSLAVGTVTAGTSFVVNSSNVLDSSNFAWIIIEPA